MRDRGVLPLVLPALDRFAEKIGRDSAALDDLMASLSRTPADGRSNDGAVAHYLRQHQNSLHQDFQWIKRLGLTGSRWELIKCKDPVYSLPRPRPLEDGSGMVQPTEVLPELRDLLEDLAITVDARYLCLKPPEPLPTAALSRLLCPDNGFNAAEVFSRADQAGYLMDVVDHVRRGRPSSADLESSLIRAARVAIQGKLPATSSPLMTPLRRLIAAIPAGYRLKLSCQGALPAEILTIDLNVLIVPTALEPEVSGAPSAARLSCEDAVRLLRTLGGLGETAGASLTSLACQVLDACDEVTRAAVLSACRSVRLFRATDVESEDYSFYSSEDLQGASVAGLVLSNSKEERGVAGQLQKALQDDRVLLVEERVSKLLFTDRLPSNRSQCIRALVRCPQLKGSGDRLDLLGYLLKDLSHDANETWAREDLLALRYLLHGRAEAYDDLEPLYHSAKRGPWAKLLKLALRLEDQDWRVIPDQLAACLNEQQELRLSLEKVDAESVSRHLGELWKQFEQANEATDVNVEPSFWSQLQLDQFSDAELTTIFADFSIDGDDQSAALCALPLHLTIGGERTSIGQLGYLEDPSRGFELDDELLAEIVVFQCESDPVRRLKQEQLFGERRLTPATIVRLAATEDEVPVHWSTLLCALSKADPDTDLEALRVKSWVPTRTGFVAPIDVPYLPDLNLRQELPDVQLTCVADLLPAFLDHKQFDAGRKLLLSANEAIN